MQRRQVQVGDGGWTSVSTLQPMMTTPITVVSCMMRRALSLDSWMPMMLSRQK